MSFVLAQQQSKNFIFEILFIFSFVYLDLLIRIQCGENAEYSTCASTCTAATCDSLRSSSSSSSLKPAIACTALCRVGCVCKKGFYRTKNGSCVPTEKCCSENEVYTTCGSACAPTCDDLRYPLPKPAKACILLCKSGCFCKQGFYRADDGSCVAPDQCCGENETYKTCGSNCIETCDSKPTECTKKCISGCFCACSDYIRQSNSAGSPCIHRNDCSEPCEEDE